MRHSLRLFLIFLGSLNFSYREVGELVDFNQHQIRFVCLFILTILIFFDLGRLKKIRITNYSILFLLFLSSRLISSIWSFDPMISLLRNIEYIVYIISIYFALDYFKLKILPKLFYLIFMKIILVFCLALIFPDQGFVNINSFFPMLQGFFPNINPNALAAFSFILFIYYSYKRFYLFNLILLPVIILSQSRFTLVFFILFFLTKVKKTYLLLLSGIVLIFSVIFENISLFMLRGQDADTIFTLSNRLNIWQNINSYFIETPMALFYGFGSFVAGREILDVNIFNYQYYNNTLITIDNSYIELIVESGLFSLILFLILIIKSYSFLKIFKANRFYETIVFIYIFVVFRGFFSSYLLWHNCYIFYIFLIMPLIYFRNYEASNI